MDLELQRDNIQHEIKELKNCLARQKHEAHQVVEIEKKNELKVLELSIEKDQVHSEMELLRSQLKQAEANLANEKQNYLQKTGLLQEQLHEKQKGTKDCVEKLKQVSLMWGAWWWMSRKLLRLQSQLSHAWDMGFSL